MLKNRLAILQIVIGLSGIVMVAASYSTFSAQIASVIDRIDQIADGGEFQLEQSQDLLSEFKEIAVELDASAIAHNRTINSAMASTETLSNTIGRWESDANAFSKISREAGLVVDKLQKQLPIQVPTFDVSTRFVGFKRPEVELGRQEFNVKYPSFNVDTKTESIDLGVKKINLKYPVGITSRDQNKKVIIADIPKVTLFDDTIDIPAIAVSHQEMLKPEKALLLETSKQLATTSASLSITAGSLADLRTFMDDDLTRSLLQTKGNLTEVSQRLRQLHAERIPSVLTKLDIQRQQLHDSRVEWSALSDFVTLGFTVLGLLPVSILLSGLGNLSVVKAERN